MYELWHQCYEEGWHTKLACLEGQGSVDGDSVIISALCADPYLAEFAAFHNSQLVQPLAGVDRALQAIATPGRR